MSENLMLDVDQAGELKAAFRRTRGSDGSQWTNAAIKKFSEGMFLGQVLDVLDGRSRIVPVEKTVLPLLEILGTIKVSATTEKFVVRDKFVRDTSRKAKVKISYLGDNFQSWFLGKIEEPAAEAELRYVKLLRFANDSEIRSEIGEALEETTLAQIFSLMELQPNGEKGILLTDGRANIFYARDKNGVLRAVYVRWVGGGWGVGASSVGRPGGWGGGRQVFFRNSCRTL